MRAAAIDVGTNSVRLYVAEVAGGRMAQIDRDLVITRLGEGVDAGKHLQPAAIDRTVDAIAGYWRRASELGVSAQAVRVAATSAVRDAVNRRAFLEAVAARTGLHAEVLSGRQEAAASFAGATTDLRNRPGPFCVLDIGGGSTEIVVGERDVDAWISLDIGSVRLTERCVRHDPPDAGEVAAVASVADRALEQAAPTHPERARTLVGLAGTITTLAAIELGLAGYDRDAIHHSTLSEVAVDKLVAHLSSMTSAERRKLPAMPAGREDVIVAGAVILHRVMRRFSFSHVLVSESDILDGLLASIVAGS